MKNLLISLSICLILSDRVHGDTDSEFIRAALDETPDRVKALLKDGANINAVDENGQTALMMASNNGRVDTVKFLIENGADVNAKDKRGETPLMFASAFDRCRVLKLLIDNGADVNAKDKGGWSALIYGAYNGRDETVRSLLRNGANAEYAKTYATRSLLSVTQDFSDLNIYVGADTSGVGFFGYTRTIQTIDKNDTFWQRVKGYFDCI